MYVGLADVFVSAIVGNEGGTVLVQLRVNGLIVVSDAGKQRGSRLVAILARNRGVGLCGLKLGAVLSSPRKSIIQRSEHTSELQSPDHLVCRLLLEKKKP